MHSHLHVQVLAFEDVGVSGTLTIAVYDRRTLSANVLLGSVCPRYWKCGMHVLGKGTHSIIQWTGLPRHERNPVCQPASRNTSRISACAAANFSVPHRQV